MEVIEIEVRCYGCNELTTPSTIDWELFRNGYHVHDNDDCKLAMIKRLGLVSEEPIDD